MASKKEKDKSFFEKVGGIFRSAGKGISKFFRDTISEVKRMIWPSPKSVFKNTGVVLVSIIVIGLFVYGLDELLIALLSLVMNLAG